VLDLKQVENLSIRGRDPMSMLEILPGVQLLANDNETVGGGFQSPVGRADRRQVRSDVAFAAHARSVGQQPPGR
jgi:hypothetical protein